MLSAHSLSNGNNCLTSFLFNVVILWLTEMAFAGNTIYGRGCDMHGASPGAGRFWPHSCPGSTQKHPSWSGQWGASLPAAHHGQVPSISPSSSWPCSLQSGHPVPLLNVCGRAMAGFPSPQPQQGFAQLPTKVGLWEGRERGESLASAFMGPCISETHLLTVAQRFLQSTARLCLSAAFLLFLRRSWHSLVIIALAKTHFMKLDSTFSIIRGRTWEQEERCWAAMPTLASLADCSSVWAVRHTVFHRKHEFISWSPLKFQLAGAEMFPCMVLAHE